MNIIDKILREPEFETSPPVLIDIGASGEIHKKWKEIAAYSVCVAFDADDREFNVSEAGNSGFKKLYRLNSLVGTTTSDRTPFHLTKSPFCSSMLEPDTGSVQNWSFADAFQVEKIVTIRSVDIVEAVDRLKLASVDWLKSDSQGIDLRLFQRLTEGFGKFPLAVEFEPGLIPVYRQEDMVKDVLAAMTGSEYWLSSLHVKGTKRINRSLLGRFDNASLRGRLPLGIRNSPCWCEMTYLHLMTGDSFSRREYLLAIVFAFIEKQYGFALELAERGSELFGDRLFRDIYHRLYRRIALHTLNIPLQLFRRAFYKYT